ncbi:MAG TPA: hypothetical protein PLU53_00490 [Bacteroidia bacterium]|nr:hypothetical protein [Bacteroidia bacterium]
MLRIRLSQLKRSFAGLPFLYWIIIGCAAAFLFYGLYIKMNNYSFSLIVTIATPLLLCILHLLRRDHRFLNVLRPDPWKVYLTEYFCLTIPVLLLLSLNQQWVLFLVVLALPAFLVLIITTLRFQSGLLPPSLLPFAALTSKIPVPGFEWRSGFRRMGWQLVVFYGLALALSFLPVASLFLLAFMTFSIGGFYADGESLAILNADLLPPKAFLKKKIFAHCRYASLLLIPALLVYVVQHPADWYLAIISWIVYMISFVFFISLKYALYRPDKKLTGDSVWVSILFVATLVPFLFPIPLFIALRNYALAKINLKTYLDDCS